MSALQTIQGPDFRPAGPSIPAILSSAAPFYPLEHSTRNLRFGTCVGGRRIHGVRRAGCRSKIASNGDGNLAAGASTAVKYRAGKKKYG
jgi:hypothetical protein